MATSVYGSCRAFYGHGVRKGSMKIEKPSGDQ